MPPAEYLLPAKVGFVSATGMLDKIQKSPHKTCYTANTDSYIALLALQTRYSQNSRLRKPRCLQRGEEASVPCLGEGQRCSSPHCQT